MKKLNFLIFSVLFSLVVLPGHAYGAAANTLTLINFPTLAYDSEYFWTIEKFASPNKWELFKGDIGTSIFMIRANRSSPVNGNYVVNGKIHVGNYDSTTNALITAVSIEFTGDLQFPVSCPVALPYSLAPGENILCSYNAFLSDGSFHTATVIVTTEGDVAGSEDVDLIDFSQISPTIINGAVTIKDTNGKSWTFTGSGAVSYEKKFSCNSDAGVHENKATILQTGQSSTEHVTISCHDLIVNETSGTSYVRAHKWKIKKDADARWLILPKGEAYPVDYKITAFADGIADLGWKAFGQVTVSNPHPTRNAELTTILDSLSLDGAVFLDCGGYTIVPADGSIICSYSKNLSSGSGQVNTATVSLRNYSYHPRNDAIVIGSTDFSNYTPIIFGDPAEQIDDAAEVFDSTIGSLGPISIGESPKTYSYSADVMFSGEESCGNHVLTSDATITADDSGNSHNDFSEINIFVSCGDNCTYTHGYWKTHLDEWMDVGDWDLDLTGEQSDEDLVPGSSWLKVLKTPTKSNLWYQLAQQWMAAYLNAINNSDITVLGTSLNTAWSWLEDNTGSDIKAKYSPQAKNWFDLFSDYNKGLLGPEACQ